MLSRSTLGFLAQGLLLAVTLGCNKPQEITVYPMNTIGNGPSYAAEIAVYRVDVQKQDVMFWRPGVVESPERLLNCAVRDSTNWRCDTQVAGDSGVVIMERGQLEETVLATRFKVRGVTKTEWERARQMQRAH